jgi:hypothetical protein
MHSNCILHELQAVCASNGWNNRVVDADGEVVMMMFVIVVSIHGRHLHSWVRRKLYFSGNRLHTRNLMRCVPCRQQKSWIKNWNSHHSQAAQWSTRPLTLHLMRRHALSGWIIVETFAFRTKNFHERIFNFHSNCGANSTSLRKLFFRFYANLRAFHLRSERGRKKESKLGSCALEKTESVKVASSEN